MSENDRSTILLCLDTEIEAVKRDIERTGPKKDWFGARQFDVREQHLTRLVSARNAALRST